MSSSKVLKILEIAYNKELAEKIIASYIEIESNYFLEKWKPSELDAGHFVEATRRLIELELTNTYTPFNAKLSDFADSVLKNYESQKGDESFRMLIPRILKSVYNIRNKRGVGHIKDISPNEMDSTLILYSVKWVLSEIVRIKSNLSIPETQKLIDDIVERKLDLIWKGHDFKRILNSSIKAKEQVLIFLYDSSPQQIDHLRKNVEYKNETLFRKIVEKLHSARLLELGDDKKCHLSPKGILAAERLIKTYKNNEG